MRSFLLWLLVAVAAGSACASGPALAPRAAFDLNCPEDRLSYTELGGKSWGVRGCGQRATYTEVCGNNGFVMSGNVAIPIKKCVWVRN